MKLGASLRSGLLAGVLAGIVLSLYSLAFTTPFIERAIVLEQSQPGAVEEAFSRNMMKFGMVVGFVLYGLLMGLLFGAVYYLTRGKLPVSREWNKGILLAFLAYWALVVLPFLKYPANPPGVGGEENVAFRQATYAGFLAISILLTTASVGFYKYLGLFKVWRLPLSVLAYGIAAFLAYSLMPAHPLPPAELPSGLVLSFRVASFLGLTLFWAVLGFSFALLWKRLNSNRLLRT